jgi:hypothetical protein
MSKRGRWAVGCRCPGAHGDCRISIDPPLWGAAVARNFARRCGWSPRNALRDAYLEGSHEWFGLLLVGLHLR